MPDIIEMMEEDERNGRKKFTKKITQAIENKEDGSKLNTEKFKFSAREIWKRLGIDSKFSDWIKYQIERLLLKEHENYIFSKLDFTSIGNQDLVFTKNSKNIPFGIEENELDFTSIGNQNSHGGDRKSIDYLLDQKSAKKIVIYSEVKSELKDQYIDHLLDTEQKIINLQQNKILELEQKNQKLLEDNSKITERVTRSVDIIGPVMYACIINIRGCINNYLEYTGNMNDKVDMNAIVRFLRKHITGLKDVIDKYKLMRTFEIMKLEGDLDEFELGGWKWNDADYPRWFKDEIYMKKPGVK